MTGPVVIVAAAEGDLYFSAWKVKFMTFILETSTRLVLFMK